VCWRLSGGRCHFTTLHLAISSGPIPSLDGVVRMRSGGGTGEVARWVRDSGRDALGQGREGVRGRPCSVGGAQRLWALYLRLWVRVPKPVRRWTILRTLLLKWPLYVWVTLGLEWLCTPSLRPVCQGLKFLLGGLKSLLWWAKPLLWWAKPLLWWAEPLLWWARVLLRKERVRPRGCLWGTCPLPPSLCKMSSGRLGFPSVLPHGPLLLVSPGCLRLRVNNLETGGRWWHIPRCWRRRTLHGVFSVTCP